jgi:hypothetical protein
MSETKFKTIALTSLVPSDYDEVDMTYDGNDNLIEAVYKRNGEIVTTLEMTYDGNDNLTNIVRV